MKKPVIAIVSVLAVFGICAGGMKVYHDKQIEKMHNEAITKVETAVDLDDYREKQQKEINGLIKDATDKINECKEQSDADKITEDTIEEIGKVKTDAQLTKEEEEAKKKAEEEARKKAEEEAERQRQAAAKSRKKSGSGSRGCVGNGSKNFY